MSDDETMTPLRIQKFISEAKPLQRLVYHVGNLAEARTTDKDLAAVAQTAYDAFAAGQCVLIQKRYGDPTERNMIYMVERRGF